MCSSRLLLLGSEAISLALELLELILILVVLGRRLRSHASIELQLEDVVIVVGHATHVTIDDVSRWTICDRFLDLLAIETCAFTLESVEDVVLVDELRWIDLHLVLLGWLLLLGLFVSYGSGEFDLKKMCNVKSVVLFKQYKIRLTFMSHSIIVTAFPGFVSSAHSS